MEKRKRNPRKKTTARKASAREGSGRRPDAIGMLKDDHKHVAQLFERFERARGGEQKERLAGTICADLTVHAQLEEELFYPAVRGAISESELLDEAAVEHDSLKQLIGQIEDSSASDERYDALVKVLGEYVKHHVKEEEGEMFKKVRQTDLDLVALGKEMQDRKRALMGDGERKEGRGLASVFFGGAGA